MDRAEVLLAARAACEDATARVTAFLRSQPNLDCPIGNSSRWTVRDAAVHLIVATNVYTEIAAGDPSPYAGVSRDAVATMNSQLAADVAETDPGKVADLLAGSLREFLDRTKGWSSERDVSFHGAIPIDLAALTLVRAAEGLLHGYDIACALGAPWLVSRDDAVLVLDGYVPWLPAITEPVTAAGHSASYTIAVRDGARWTLRFTAGTCALDPDDGASDCTLMVDPVAFLLALTGRASRWPAFALGLFTVEGPQPELGPGFFDLIAFP